MKKILTTFALLCLLSPAACMDDGLSINVGEQQIESKLAQYFPVHKEALMGKLQIDLTQPDLILKAGSDRAELLLQSRVTTGPASWPGNFRVSFGLDYAAETGTFYLIEPRIESFDMKGVPATVSSGVSTYLLPLVQQYLTRVPVYTLKTESNAQNIARHTLKKIAIEDKNLKVTLGLNP